jgi:hypothetical protein
MWMPCRLPSLNKSSGNQAGGPNGVVTNGLDPQAYLADILDRIHDRKINQLDELLPWNWTSMAMQNIQAA